jgi:hypothetical protein
MDGGDMVGLMFLGFCIVFAAMIFVAARVYQLRPDFVGKVLRYALIGAFVAVFGAVSVLIGFRISDRHHDSYSKSLRSVEQIWGGAIAQAQPAFYWNETVPEERTDEKTGRVFMYRREVGRAVGFQSQKIDMKVIPKIRTKGLLQFPGYRLEFRGEYLVKNITGRNEKFTFLFMLPQNAGNITDIAVEMNGDPYRGDSNFADNIEWDGRLAPGDERRFVVRYAAQGVRSVKYDLSSDRVEIRSMAVEILTGFTDITIPDGAMAPASSTGDGDGARIRWTGENLVTGQNVAAEFDMPGNYGERAAKLFFYAPLAFIFFIGLVLLVSVAKSIPLHPMHYLFLLAGFFVFYLLGSYLMSYVPIIPALFISLAVSTGIMLYYMFLLKRGAEIVKSVALAAGIFQWLFSLAFFVPEHTGFIITVASIIALVILMRSTASVDWANKW